MLNKIKIVELFKELLSAAYKGKKRIYYQLGFKGLVVYKKLKKNKGLINLRELVVKP